MLLTKHTSKPPEWAFDCLGHVGGAAYAKQTRSQETFQIKEHDVTLYTSAAAYPSDADELVSISI